MEGVTLSKAIEIGVQAGIKEALDRIHKVSNENVKTRHDKRFRNTSLLLKNYNDFIEHCNNAIFTSSKIEKSDISDLLDEVKDIDDPQLYVNSIKRTHARTNIIVEHVKTIIEFYKFKAERSKDENALRRYKVIDMIYMKEPKMTYSEVAEKLDISEKTVSRDRKQAINELSVLIFGVDGMKLEM